MGQLYEEWGEVGKAVEAYTRFTELWADADPELQPRLEAAQQALSRLEGSSSREGG